MKKLSVLVIDDERLAREELKRHLENYADFIVAGEAGDADEAEVLINTIKPELLFLDIQMPGRSGFDLLQSLHNVPAVIFTTAFDEYAVKAFEVNAIDYLVKPIREERFAKAIARVRDQYAGKEGDEKILSPEQSIFVKEGERFCFIKIKDIWLIESAGNYARLYFNSSKVLMKRSLNQLEKIFDAQLFFRINRNEMINTSFIQNIHALPKGRLIISLKTGKELVVSNRQSATFKKRKPV
jgi:two-component system, LytTR family, response regulator